MEIVEYETLTFLNAACVINMAQLEAMHHD